MVNNRGTIVFAVGGNSLITDSDHTSVKDQAVAAEESMQHIAEMVAQGWSAVVTHGNGPQVGFLLRRAELASNELPIVPLDVLVADTQGATGYLFTKALNEEFDRLGIDKKAVAIVTQTVVKADDPAFNNPSKPVGSFMDEEDAKQHVETDGWLIMEDAGRGWRRVVPSPKPQRIVEIEAIRRLIDAGVVVVAGGGGGIPVVEEGSNFRGVEAVIDKDYATSLLANQLSAEVLLISTAVDAVAINFDTPQQLWLDRVSVSELREYLAAGQFGAGSMAPKIEAAIAFIEGGGSRVIITSPKQMVTAFNGKSGTTIIP